MGDSRPLADKDEVAAYVNVPVRTLDQWAYLGRGPRYIKVGRHRRYRWADVESWLDEQAAQGRGARA